MSISTLTAKKSHHKKFVLLLVVFFSLFSSQTVSAQRPFPNPPVERLAAKSRKAVAVLAGGCFWGMEGVFERLKGVTNVVSGYSGGKAGTADYNMVSTGGTGHAESVRIEYDPSQITYGTLLKVFFSVAHDPTELNYQGPDHGTQYRSVIFYADEKQKKVAELYIQAIDRARVFPSKVVTQVTPLKAFYPAENYHQDFMRLNPSYPYIVYWDVPKVRHLERAYPELIQAK
jgi:peptide-methionine (S)-S-oxide reductase